MTNGAPGTGAPLDRLSLPRDPFPSGCDPFRVSVGLLDYTIQFSFCKPPLTLQAYGIAGKFSPLVLAFLAESYYIKVDLPSRHVLRMKKRRIHTSTDTPSGFGFYFKLVRRSSCTIMVMAST